MTRSQITLGEVLDLDCRRALDAQHQRGRFAGLRRRPGAAIDLDRLAVGRDLGADDVGPARHQFGRGETLPRESVADDLAEQVAQRFGVGARGLVHGAAALPSIWTMIEHDVAAKPRRKVDGAQRRQRRTTSRRSPPSCSPGTTAIAARCRGARAPGERADPYRVWLSEIMLQQTTVKAVAPYFARFLARWPDVAALAAAPLDDVLEAWAGLGYYARARNLHACARAVVGATAATFPDSEAELRALPGIGAYTAAAIAAIAFDRAGEPVDGNVERVIARLFAVESRCRPPKPRSARWRATLTPQQRAGDFAQAMMDLGATICTPKKPACALCPWHDGCAARARGDAETFPRKAPKPKARCAAARPSSRSAPTAASCCARARRRACSAA